MKNKNPPQCPRCKKGDVVLEGLMHLKIDVKDWAEITEDGMVVDGYMMSEIHNLHDIRWNRNAILLKKRWYCQNCEKPVKIIKR